MMIFLAFPFLRNNQFAAIQFLADLGVIVWLEFLSNLEHVVNTIGSVMALITILVRFFILVKSYYGNMTQKRKAKKAIQNHDSI